MTAKCERCGQTILPDETVCWQCGARLIPTPGTTDTPAADTDESGPPPISWAMLMYLGVSTAVTLLLLIWLMSLLA
ncbi:MAG: hypothetical protein KJ069_05050 [Anaerolineae bacterium]|nr:hypothetical protein [Anaerolineae bacterium]